MNRQSMAPGLDGGKIDAAAVVPARPGWFWRHLDLWSLIWIGATLILLFLVVAPMLRLFISSFQSTETGAFTLMNYVTAYGNERRLIGLGNSLLYGEIGRAHV